MTKIKFKVSQITQLDPKIINGLILLKLKDEKYDILKVTVNSVEFYDNPWVFRWNFQQVGRLDGGIFTIDTSDSQTSITLNYYLNVVQSFIGASIPLIGTIILHVYEGTVVFLAFIIIALSIQALISKNSARDLLDTILNTDIMN